MDRDRLEEAWPVDEPPQGFAERVVERALEERAPRRRRGPTLAVASVLLAAAAAVLLWFSMRPVSSGAHLARERTELRLGNEASVVLEAGAKIDWRGREISQAAGEVFYRVEPGGPFVVKTPAGDVSVLGTCFRVRVGTAAPKGEHEMKRRDLAVAAGSAALAAVAVVTVYEGKVQLSHAGERVGLSAGEAGKLGPGAKKVSPEELADAEESLEGSAGGGLATANENLARDISELNRRLKGIEKEKTKLEEQLSSAERELAKRTDGGAARGRHEFDLDQQDWSELAKDGTIKYRHPCFKPDGWKPGPERLEELGLAPDDVEPIDAAYKRSYERIWKTIRPLCAKAIGNADVVDVLGPDTCTHVVVDAMRKQEGAGVSEAMRLVSEIRAGQKPPPVPGKEHHPVFDLFWGLTGEMGAFEADLAQTFGPEEAKRLAYSKALCAGHSTFGGPGPREK
ncbi:MAG: FecR domain-containing protein [Myxococcales bacterium]|nr:FecR domain-containing protein [Myxococcales bacterium]